eukprot:TRINITY_DN5240_c0_g2_i1.p2 TRINITY_DN5240_c0_g2~~TRINITY_DN5240_c0_g2_i1.p2  ORF type:complete len:106 (+),score=2.69 TRINITY_DN5240_c0_g2_i1:1191-1508(+)
MLSLYHHQGMTSFIVSYDMIFDDVVSGIGCSLFIDFFDVGLAEIHCICYEKMGCVKSNFVNLLTLSDGYREKHCVEKKKKIKLHLAALSIIWDSLKSYFNSKFLH